MSNDELNALVTRLELRADNGDMGRKPDPATLDRLTISAIRQLEADRDRLRNVLTLGIKTIEELAEQQAIHDPFYRPVLAELRAAALKGDKT